MASRLDVEAEFRRSVYCVSAVVIVGVLVLALRVSGYHM